MSSRLRDEVTADMIAVLERHRDLHGTTDPDTTPADEHFFTMMADGIRYSLNTYGGHNPGGGVADAARWKSATAAEVADAITGYLRGSLSPKLFNIHAEVNAESTALIDYLKDELIEARRLLAEHAPAAPRPEPLPQMPAPVELPGQASLLEELETI